MSRKFEQTEIDIIYEQLRPEEEVLWRGKPKLVPNISYISTLFLLILSLLIIIILRFIQLKNENEHFYQDFYSLSLILLALSSVIYIFIYSNKYYKKILNIFYVITNARLAIFDSKKGKIVFSKRYSTIKLVRLKKTIFDSGTIVFDIDFIDDRIKEIGFINIEQADDVLNIINHQLYHIRNKD